MAANALINMTTNALTNMAANALINMTTNALTNMATRVSRKVAAGVTLGKTACSNSCTSPPVLLVTLRGITSPVARPGGDRQDRLQVSSMYANLNSCMQAAVCNRSYIEGCIQAAVYSRSYIEGCIQAAVCSRSYPNLQLPVLYQRHCRGPRS